MGSLSQGTAFLARAPKVKERALRSCHQLICLSALPSAAAPGGPRSARPRRSPRAPTTPALSQIERDAVAALQVVQGADMRVGEVGNTDVVAHRGAVRGRVV